jgi:hypothetical protein
MNWQSAFGYIISIFTHPGQKTDRFTHVSENIAQDDTSVSLSQFMGDTGLEEELDRKERMLLGEDWQSFCV